MKPQKLKLENFGPYQDAVVDFSHFENVPLFLISGKTGSGKTTIFDGICYALFGETSGKERRAEQMRSLFADDNDKTRVTFEFNHQGINYKITREPKYKKDGNKNETPAKVILEYRDNDGELMTLTKKNDVNQFINDLLHLNVDQFTQIVLLPQQKFRKFLSANSSDKEVVLRQVFGTEIFEKWTQKIRDILKEKKTNNQALLNRLKTNMEAIELENDEIKGIQDWLDAVSNLIDEKQQELIKAKVKLEKLNIQKDKLNDEIKQAQQLQENLDKQKELKDKQDQLEKEKSYIEETKRQISNLEWARDNSEIFLKVQHHRKDLDEKQVEFEKTKSQLVESQKEQSQIEQTFDQLKNKKDDIEKLKITQQGLKDKQPLFEHVDKLADELRNKKQTVTRKNQANEKKQAEIKQLQDGLQQLKQKNAKFGDLANKQIKINERQHQLKDLQSQLKELQKNQSQLDELQQKITTTSEELTKQLAKKQLEDQKYQEVKQKFAKYQVIYYASQLEDDQPCPVCGSRIHPDPADQKAENVEHVTEEQVKQSEESVKKIEQTVTKLQTERSGLQKQYDDLKHDFEEKSNDLNIKEDSLLDLIEHNNSELNQLKFSQEQLSSDKKEQENNEKEIETIEKKLDSANKSQNDLQQELNNVQQQAIDLQARYDEQRKSLPEDYDTLEKLNQQIVQNKKQIHDFEEQFVEVEEQNDQIKRRVAAKKAQLGQLQNQMQKTQDELKINEQQLNEILHEHNVSEEQFEQWLDQKNEIVEKQGIVTKHNEAIKVNQQLLAEVTAKINDQELPDLEKMQSQLQNFNEETTVLNRLIGENGVEIKNKENIVEKVKDLWKKQKVQQNELDSLEELSQVVISGTSERKMGFEKFVLREYFKEVLAVGTQILTKLTNGRYSFVLQQQALRNVASETGLEIDIYDDEAGERRSVHTLSGGESFIAALSLALALGEVIQRQNGGIQIEMLFIDEGFGSLDEEALQSALETLRSLESQNRMIGIISHVKDLHAQIPAQINVISHNGQSEIRYRN